MKYDFFSANLASFVVIIVFLLVHGALQFVTYVVRIDHTDGSTTELRCKTGQTLEGCRHDDLVLTLIRQ